MKARSASLSGRRIIPKAMGLWLRGIWATECLAESVPLLLGEGHRSERDYLLFLVVEVGLEDRV